MVKPSDRDVLLLHLLADEVTCRAAVDHLEPQQFSGASERSHQVLWYIVRDNFLRTQRLPAAALIMTQARTYLKDFPLDLAEAEVLVNAAASLRPEIFMREEAYRILEDFLIERKVGGILNRQLANGQIDRHQMDALLAARESVRISTVKPFDPMDLSSFGEDYKEPSLTGVSWLDKPLKGGITPGELYGFLGPSGGGKTTAGVQITCSMAEYKKHVVYLHYEFPLDTNFLIRVYSCITGLPRDRFTAKGLKNLEQADMKLLQDASNRTMGYMHYVDMSQRDRGFGGVDEIAAIVDELCRTTKVDLVIADWMLPLCNRYMEKHGIRDDGLRSTINRQMEKAKTLVRSSGVPWMIMHQTSTMAQEKPPSYCPQQTDAAESKGFYFNLDAQFMLGKRDGKTKCHWFTMNKASNRPATQMVLRFDGEHCRFVEDANYEWDETIREFRPRDRRANTRASDADEFTPYGEDEVTVD